MDEPTRDAAEENLNQAIEELTPENYALIVRNNLGDLREEILREENRISLGRPSTIPTSFSTEKVLVAIVDNIQYLRQAIEILSKQINNEKKSTEKSNPFRKGDYNPDWLIKWNEPGQIEGSNALVDCKASDVVKWRRNRWEEQFAKKQYPFDPDTCTGDPQFKIERLKKLSDREVLMDFMADYWAWIDGEKSITSQLTGNNNNPILQS